MSTQAPESQWIRAVALLGLLIIWHVVAAWLNDPILPEPLAVLETLYRGVVEGELLEHLGITLLRVAAAFMLAFGIGSVIGILMGRSALTNSLLDIMLIIGLNIPALVTIILCYIWFGLNEAAAITAVAINKIPTTVVMLREGARAVDQQLMQVARVYRLPPWQTLTKVYLPQLYPYFMAAARNGLALIWKIVLVVELLGRSDGIGFQLGVFFQFFDIQTILAYTLAFVVVILLVESCLLRPFDKVIARGRA